MRVRRCWRAYWKRCTGHVSGGADMGNTCHGRAPAGVQVRGSAPAVAASKRTGTLLPRSVYGRAGARVLVGASNELQRRVRMPRRRRWHR